MPQTDSNPHYLYMTVVASCSGLKALKRCTAKLEEKVSSIEAKLEKMNIDVLKEKVEVPLARAGRRVKDIASTFWFVRSFRARASEIAAEEIGRDITPDLRDKVQGERRGEMESVDLETLECTGNARVATHPPLCSRWCTTGWWAEERTTWALSSPTQLAFTAFVSARFLWAPSLSLFSVGDPVNPAAPQKYYLKGF